jgi:Family of unknown function (DUF5641)
LYKIIGNQILSLEEFNTLIIKIEFVLNNRPLTFTQCDHTSKPLVPFHLLTGKIITTASNIEELELKENLSLRRKLINQMYNDFWVRWSKEYLPNLFPRSKWKSKNNEILAVGDIVILREETKNHDWPLARIERVEKGADNLIRSVWLKMANGKTISRAIRYIIPLNLPNAGGSV